MMTRCVKTTNKIEPDIQSRILTIRGVQVLLDRDLAELYGVEVKRLNEQVNRNIERFPERFMHQLTQQEFADLKLQIATSSLNASESRLKSQFATSSWGGVRKPPRVFTEQGVSMLSAVLRSPTAIDVSIRIMDAFVAMRHVIASFAPLLARIEANERRQIVDQAKNDANQARNEERFEKIFDAMNDKAFVERWMFRRGSEKGEDQQFWNDLLREFDTPLVDRDPYLERELAVNAQSTCLIGSDPIRQVTRDEIPPLSEEIRPLFLDAERSGKVEK